MMKQTFKYVAFAIFTLFLTACSSFAMSEEEQGYRDYQKAIEWKEQHIKAAFVYINGLDSRTLEQNRELLVKWKSVAPKSSDELQIKTDLAKQYIDKSLLVIYSSNDMLSALFDGDRDKATHLKAISDKYAQEADEIEQQLHQKFAK